MGNANARNLTMNQANTLHAESATTKQYATFRVGQLLLGLRIDLVQEINRHVDITPVPHAPESIQGCINLRGEVVTVVNLGPLLGLPDGPDIKQARNVIVHHEDQLVGLLVEEVSDILQIVDHEILPPPANLSGVQGRFFKGVYPTEDEIVVILDLAETLK